MRYTARAVTASSAPWPLTLGGTTYWARPLSAALVLELFPRMTDPTSQADAVFSALRAAFPLPARGLEVLGALRRDPVRRIAALPAVMQAEIVERLFAIPGHATTAEEDPEAALIAAHRKLAHPHESKTGPTLAIAALTCEVRLGAAWYFNRDRWPTTDGFAPLAAVWTTYQGLMALDAKDRLSMASAVRLGMADGVKSEKVWKQLETAAYPADPTMRAHANG
jgi:hypothetical protein